MSRLVAALVLLVAAAPPMASAQGGSSEIVIVAEAGAVTLDLERVGARVAVETGAAVRIATESVPGTATLRVRVEGGARLVVVLVRADGSRMERETDVPDDATERTETVAILAVNMLHDEAAELLALLGPREAEPPIVVVEASPEAATIVVVEEVAEPAPLPIGDADLLEAPAAPVGPPRDPFLRLGLAGHLTSVPHGRSAEVDFFAGLELAWTPAPWIALGARDITGGGTSQGSGWHADGSPFVELGLPISFLTLYADLGVHLQVLGEERRSSPSVGAAPFLVAGARFRLAREVSIGLETTMRVVATDSFLSGLYSLPQAAAIWSGGLSLLFHVS